MTARKARRAGTGDEWRRSQGGYFRIRERMSWTQRDLARRRKGGPGKARLASEQRAGTRMPVTWMGQRFDLCRRGYLTWLLCYGPQGQPSCMRQYD
jgi:hypothetical protein